MLRVFMASGEEALAMALADFAMEEQPARVLAIKRHLHRLTGQPRFKQRLVLSDGEMLPDDAVLQNPMDLQLVLLPFEASSQRQIWELQQTARFNNIPAMERLLQRSGRSGCKWAGCSACRPWLWPRWSCAFADGSHS